MPGKQQAKSISKDYYPSDKGCDIPLREPLDPEYRLNRKLAKQIYNKERKEIVQKRKVDLVENWNLDVEKREKDLKKMEKDR